MYTTTTTQSNRMYTCYTCGGQFRGYSNLMRHKSIWHNRYLNTRLVERERLLNLIENQLNELSQGLNEKEVILQERERNVILREQLIMNRETQLNNLETNLFGRQRQLIQRELLAVPLAPVRATGISPPPPPPPPPVPVPYHSSQPATGAGAIEASYENEMEELTEAPVPRVSISLDDDIEIFSDERSEASDFTTFGSESDTWEERAVEAIEDEEERNAVYQKHVEENDKCGVCLHDIRDFSLEQVVVLTCKHVVCTYCCNSMLTRTLRKCPVCRKDF